MKMMEINWIQWTNRTKNNLKQHQKLIKMKLNKEYDVFFESLRELFKCRRTYLLPFTSVCEGTDKILGDKLKIASVSCNDVLAQV